MWTRGVTENGEVKSCVTLSSAEFVLQTGWFENMPTHRHSPGGRACSQLPLYDTDKSLHPDSAQWKLGVFCIWLSVHLTYIKRTNRLVARCSDCRAGEEAGPEKRDRCSLLLTASLA